MQTVDRIRGIKGTDVFYDIVQIQLLMASGREQQHRYIIISRKI